MGDALAMAQEVLEARQVQGKGDLRNSIQPGANQSRDVIVHGALGSIVRSSAAGNAVAGETLLKDALMVMTRAKSGSLSARELNAAN